MDDALRVFGWDTDEFESAIASRPHDEKSLFAVVLDLTDPDGIPEGVNVVVVSDAEFLALGRIRTSSTYC
jgi:hypothetical protein